MDVFAALADPVRRDLLLRIAVEPRSVNELVAAHDVSRPAISRHLRVLRTAGLVHVTTVGRRRLYRLDAEALAPVRHLLERLEPMPPVAEHQLDALELEVRRTVRERGTATSSRNTEKETG